MVPEILASVSAANILKKGGSLKSGNMGPLLALGAAAAVGTGGAAVFKKGHRPMFIEEGYVGVRTRRGQPIMCRRGENTGKAKIAYPGFGLAFPVLNSFRIVSIQDRSLDLEQKEVERTEGQFLVDGSVFWGIQPDIADRSIFKTDSLVASVGKICQSALRVAATAVEHTQVHEDLEHDLFKHMKEHSQERLERYGAELRAFNLGVFARTKAQMDQEGSMAIAKSVLTQDHTSPAVASVLWTPGMP